MVSIILQHLHVVHCFRIVLHMLSEHWIFAMAPVCTIFFGLTLYMFIIAAFCLVAPIGSIEDLLSVSSTADHFFRFHYFFYLTLHSVICFNAMMHYTYVLHHFPCCIYWDLLLEHSFYWDSISKLKT